MLGKKTVAKIEATIAAAETELQRARQEAHAAQSEYSESLLEDGLSSERSAALLRTAGNAGERADALERALSTLRAQLKDAQEAENRAALKLRWKEALKLSEDRLRAARLVGDAAAALATAYAELVRVNEQLYPALPGGAAMDMDAVLLRRDQIGGAVRIELARLGCEFAVSRMEQPHIVEGVASKFERADGWLKGLAGKAGAA